jgi:hypothetical protein
VIMDVCDLLNSAAPLCVVADALLDDGRYYAAEVVQALPESLAAAAHGRLVAGLSDGYLDGSPCPSLGYVEKRLWVLTGVE